MSLHEMVAMSHTDRTTTGAMLPIPQRAMHSSCLRTSQSRQLQHTPKRVSVVGCGVRVDL
eukprot:5079-Eustigmatos_ZCMA.PRE.1